MKSLCLLNGLYALDLIELDCMQASNFDGLGVTVPTTSAALGGANYAARKLTKIGSKIVRHGRYVTFQLAEVAVPRNLFREILRLVDELRQRTALA